MTKTYLMSGLIEKVADLFLLIFYIADTPPSPDAVPRPGLSVPHSAPSLC